MVSFGDGGVGDGRAGNNYCPQTCSSSLMGTPRYLRVVRMSMIWTTAVLAATNSDP